MAKVIEQGERDLSQISFSKIRGIRLSLGR